MTRTVRTPPTVPSLTLFHPVQRCTECNQAPNIRPVTRTPETPPTDRREALKLGNRRAIVAAAAVLADARGLDGFTVNDLAERAGLSRRTIFNHFATVDDAVYASFADRISGLYADVERDLGDRRFATLAEAFEAFAEAVRRVDVIGTVREGLAPLGPTACEPAVPSSAVPDRREVWAMRITDGIVRECATSLQDRLDDADPLQIRLLVDLLVATVKTCVEQWFQSTDGELSARGRREWDRLLEAALSRLRHGFGDRPPA